MPDNYLKNLLTISLATFLLQTETKLTEEQNKICLKIMESVNIKVRGIYFIDAFSGIRKHLFSM